MNARTFVVERDNHDVLESAGKSEVRIPTLATILSRHQGDQDNGERPKPGLELLIRCSSTVQPNHTYLEERGCSFLSAQAVSFKTELRGLSFPCIM